MRCLGLALVVLALSLGSAADAAEPDRPKRWSVSLRAGGFDEQGSAGMLRRDGAPGNPVLGWKGSPQVGAAVAFDVRPGVTLDLSAARLDFEFGSDLVPAGPGSELVSTKIATGHLEDFRLAIWLDPAMLEERATYYVSPRRAPRGRFALVVVVAVTKAGDVEPTDEARGLLGVERLETDRQTSAGLGARLDYRLGRSAWSIGAELDWTWRLGGELVTVETSPASPYGGSALAHEGPGFMADLSWHF